MTQDFYSYSTESLNSLADAIEKAGSVVLIYGTCDGHLTDDQHREVVAALRRSHGPSSGSSAPSEIRPMCVCGNSQALNVVHRTDGPCFHYAPPSATAPIFMLPFHEVAQAAKDLDRDQFLDWLEQERINAPQ